MEGEKERLEELLEAARAVKEETKIRRIVELVREQFDGESVLFFTEYKATQSLLMSTLIREFGADSTTFINGEETAKDVMGKTIRTGREQAAELFNQGKVRFLVSTEAAGEGIDLQRNCHSLIHVDLPWNPMRLHQRVGRVNRYGQKHQVKVVSLRNPATVESLIWEKLNFKIDRIQKALSSAMDEPEDLLQLVLGMTSSSFFTDLFSQASEVPKESFTGWFDRTTASFGGKDVVDTVQSLVGNSTKFDYQAVSSKIPRLDLPDLEAFFRLMLALNKRRVSLSDGGISFVTPDVWRDEIGVRSRYSGLIFQRDSLAADADQRILGVGHKLFGKALAQARTLEAFNALLPRNLLKHPLLVFRLSNRVTTDESLVRSVLLGAEMIGDKISVLQGEDLFRRLTNLAQSRSIDEVAQQQSDTSLIATTIKKAQLWIEDNQSNLELPFNLPKTQLQAVIWPIDEVTTPTHPR